MYHTDAIDSDAISTAVRLVSQQARKLEIEQPILIDFVDRFFPELTSWG